MKYLVKWHDWFDAGLAGADWETKERSFLCEDEAVDYARYLHENEDVEEIEVYLQIAVDWEE